MNEFLFNYTKEDFRNDLKTIIAETIRENTPENETTQEPELLTRKETANKFHISLVTLHRLTKEGTLKSYNIGGRVLYKTAETKQALTENHKKYRR